MKQAESHTTRPAPTNRRYGLAAGVLLGALALPGCTEPASPPERPDIILVMVDTLRADHLGCYGYAGDTSPNIDRFSRQALLFGEGARTAAATGRD